MATRSESPIPLAPLKETDPLLAEGPDFGIHDDLDTADQQTIDVDDQQEAETMFQGDTDHLGVSNTQSKVSLDVLDLITNSVSIERRVPTERQRVQDILQQLTNLNILITGLTGSGKSSLANAFLGKKRGDRGAAKEGDDIQEGCTEHVRGRASHRSHQSGITIWDTPGLMDGSDKEKQYLKEMKVFWKRKNSYDLVIYCVKADTRFVDGKDNNDVKAMITLKKKFGQDLWKNAVIVLTFANNIESIMPSWRDIKDSKEKKAEFNVKIEHYEDRIHKNLIKHVKVKEEIVKRIPVVPAGHLCMPVGLEGGEWFSNLFKKCLKTIPTSAGQATFLAHNRDRIVEGGGASTNQIILKEDFIPAKLLELQKDYAKKGGHIGILGMLGGPLGIITIPLGWWTGGMYGEAEYIKQLQRARDLSSQDVSINRECYN